MLQHGLRNCMILIGLLVIVAGVTTSCASVAASWVAAHNKYRCVHGVPPVSWSAYYANVAEWRAKNCQQCVHCTCQGSNCQPQYAKQYAENATCWQGTAQEAVDAWYSEIKNYDYNNPAWSTNTGHFINVVVSTAKNIGCFCANQHCYCDYDSMYNTAPAVLSQVVPKQVNSEQFCQSATYSAGTGWTKQP